ncbi:unnamed protein product [Miscanthus lutarioriparius]|uniref:Protein kinase domain-containing protein n=1 Tax=Miscanthus lutarioriparius TaxID=422564 RepID=A0A811QDJ9_9POAL|nr:unnamed protein product [Miscanthus lutarioriparius]
MLVCIQVYNIRSQLSKPSEMTTNTRSSLLSTLPKDIPASFLKQITDDFSPARELGKGAFGTVYKGIAENGEMIAVKKLGENSPVANEKTFSNEKKVVQHNGRYIIVDIAEVFLCYEYLPMGSLDKYLFEDIWLQNIYIEISTGEKNIPNAEDKCGRKFIEKVQKRWTDGHISSKYTSFDPDRLQQIKMCVEIGLQCVEHERKMRPSIADIVEKLNAMQE